MCSKPKQNDCWPTGRAIFLFWSTGTLSADHRRLSVWLCACGHFFECLLDLQTLPPGSSTLISACKRSFPATDCEQWVGCETECNVETVSGNGSVSHTALYRSNLTTGRSSKLEVFTVVLRPLCSGRTHCFWDLWYNDEFGKTEKRYFIGVLTSRLE